MLNTQNLEFAVDIHVVILSSVTMFLTTLYVGISKKPLKGLIWIIRKKAHIPVQAQIVECTIFEREGVSKADDSRGNSQYFPEIKVAFEYNDKHYTSTMPLTSLGYEDPTLALSHLTKVAPQQSIKYVHTYEEWIYASLGPFFKQIRITEDTKQKNFITLMINPKKPADNQANYNTYSIKDWLPFFLFAMMPVGMIPALPSIHQALLSKFDFTTLIATISWSILLYFIIAKTISHINKKYIGKTVGRFQILFDKNYDGSQVEPYLEKKQQ